jgi:glycosyltransferase involved in cell wall biosynthesis
VSAKTPARIAVVSEDLGLPLDEGIKKFAVSLLRALSEHASVLGVSTGGAGGLPEGAERASANRLFLGNALRRSLASFSPDVICYVPSASGTAFSFLRARMLKLYRPSAHVAMVALQGRAHGAVGRLLVSRLQPDYLFAQSQATIDELSAAGGRARFLPSGVDVDAFHPVSPRDKVGLRRKHGLPPDEYLVLHVGHLKPGRNVSLLSRIGNIGRPVLVAGSSTGQDAVLRRELEAAGVTVIDRFVAEVQEFYQAADCYLFPTLEPGSAIDVPLSVLEAMACDLPVVSSPFGGLPLMFEEGPGLQFAGSDERILEALGRVKEAPAGGARRMVERYSWREVAARFLAEIEQPSEVNEYAGAVTL